LSKNISWESRVNILARKIGVIDVVNDVSMSTKTRLSEICDVLTDNDTAKWERDLQTQDKLRTYRLYKRKFQSEPYCTMPMSRGHRSILFKFRCSNLQLSIETGRYAGKPIHEIVCTLCTGDLVEDERHFLMNCTAYPDLRFHLVKAAVLLNDYFNDMAEIEQFVF
jgi:hypothetical protein